jgi:hypothetical protein
MAFNLSCDFFPSNFTRKKTPKLRDMKKRYANNPFLKNCVSKHYAVNHFFRKTQFGIFFHQIENGHL